MPNHVTNVLVAPSEVLTALFGEDDTVDFNTVIPEPHYADPVFTAERSEIPGMGVGYGVDGYSPIDWHREYWGTKWNAYEVQYSEDNSTELSFQTAWSHPLPVIEALSRRFPETYIVVRYADEDLGSNVGTYVMLDGVITSQSMPDYGPESLELASDILYGMTYAEVEKEWGDNE